MVKKVIQLPPILDCIDYCSFPVHLLQVFFHAFTKAYSFKESIEKPVEKESRFMIKYIRIKSFSLRCIHRLIELKYSLCWVESIGKFALCVNDKGSP